MPAVAEPEEQAPPSSEVTYGGNVQEHPTTPFGPGRRFFRFEAANALKEELNEIHKPKVVASTDKIAELFTGKCKEGCSSTTSVKSRVVGCTLEIWRSCEAGHSGKWASSEDYHGVYANNLQFSAASLLSGNNYNKVELFSKFLGLGCPSELSYLRHQRFYCIPAIEEWWQWMRANIVSLIGSLEVIVFGDGQSDSPGHSAKYLTYYVMLTKQLEQYILHSECVDKREVGLKSPNMEREALKRAVESLKRVIKLREVVTDASSSIIKMMADDFKKIIHSLDIWHKAKNMRKCLTKVAKLKGNEKIDQWTDHIINHFWFACENCEGSIEKLKTLWMSLLHHVSNQHERSDGKCQHDEAATEQHQLPWFDRRDKDYRTLQEFVLNPKLLATLKFYINFRHTRSLEVANSHSLMYAPKRCAFGFEGFKAQKTLAAIDHNYHLYRQPLKDANGQAGVSRKYVPRTKCWTYITLKEEKDYAYIPKLMAKVF